MSIERETLRRLIEELPEDELKVACRYLEFVLDHGNDPVRWALEHAPLDAELETDDERTAVDEARRDMRTGLTKSSDELKRELGL